MAIYEGTTQIRETRIYPLVYKNFFFFTMNENNIISKMFERFIGAI